MLESTRKQYEREAKKNRLLIGISLIGLLVTALAAYFILTELLDGKSLFEIADTIVYHRPYTRNYLLSRGIWLLSPILFPIFIFMFYKSIANYKKFKKRLS